MWQRETVVWTAVEAAVDMIDWGASTVDGWFGVDASWFGQGFVLTFSGSKRRFSIGIPDVSGRNSGCFVAQSYIPTILHSYIPTILQSYNPTFLQSYIPTLPISLSSFLSPSLLLSLSLSLSSCY